MDIVSNAIMDLQVMIVEDDILALQWLEKILVNRVKQIVTATNGVEALKRFEEGNIDLIITDLMMPDMSGIELIDSIQRIRTCSVIVMTSYNDSETLEQLVNRHITFFLHKPIEVEQLYLMVSHVDEIHTAQRELAQKEGLLRKQMVHASMGEMLSVIAHQWKQPLSIINAIVSELQMEAMVKDAENLDYTQALEHMTTQIAFLSDTMELFRNLFNPNKQPSTFRIRDLLDQATELFQSPLTFSNVEIEIHDTTTGLFRGYPDELFHALLIMMSNAIEAFDPAQRVKKIAIRIAEECERLHLSIEDNAGGMSPDVIPKIFDRYFTTKAHNKGTGIGLYIAKMIIENRCCGTIDVEPIPSGSRFNIRLSDNYYAEA